MNNSSSGDDHCLTDEDSFPFEDFAPTLAQCFLIVIAGYLAAKLQLLSASDIRGVSSFVAYIGMPAIICITLADADFDDLRWELLFGLFLGKLFVFVIVAAVTMFVDGSSAVAGVMGIFAVHTNDLPVGNPLMSALYKNTRTHMMKYLFLMPAMTMMIFIPLGTFLIEINKSKRTTISTKLLDAQKEKKIKHSDIWTTANDHNGNNKSVSSYVGKKELSAVLYSLVKSGPVIIASTLGILFNFARGEGHLPAVIHQPVIVLAQTVPGCVLSVLGFNMVRRERSLITSAMVSATVLVAVKMILTPIAMHSFTHFLTGGYESSKNLSDFALLYGILSPATGIFLAGQEFRKPLAAMSAALIISSFLCFPTSFIVAKLTIVPNCSLNDYVPYLKNVLFWTASFSIVCDIIVVASVLLKKKWKDDLHRHVINFTIIQIFICSGVLFWSLNTSGTWGVYLQALLFYGGELFEYVWIATISVALILSGPCPAVSDKIHKILMVNISVSGLCIVFLCSEIYLYGIEIIHVVGTPKSIFDFNMLAIFTALLTFCVVVSAVCILLFFRSQHKEYHPSLTTENIVKSLEYDNPTFYYDINEVKATQYRKRVSSASILSVASEREEEDLYYFEINSAKGLEEIHRHKLWNFRFFTLFLLLWITLCLKLFSNVYKLIRSTSLEIVIPLEFLQSIFFVGQGFFVFLTFGIDIRTLSIETTKWWRRIRHGKEEYIPSKYDLDIDKEFCHRFRTFFYAKCFQSLAKVRRWKEDTYSDCFWGHQLVDWLIREGVAKDDTEAEELGQKLLAGDVICHVTGAHHFHDAPYLYKFVCKSKNEIK